MFEADPATPPRGERARATPRDGAVAHSAAAINADAAARVRDDASAGHGALRIAFASYRTHPHVGGQGVYVRAVTAALADLGHRVDVVSGPPYPDLDPRVGLIRLPSLDLFARDNAFAAFRPRFLGSWPDLAEWALHNTGAFGEVYAFGARFADWARAHGHRYDVIHDNQGLSQGLLAAQRAGPPAVATLHHPISADLDCALAAEPRLWRRMLLRRWHGFVRTQAAVARQLPALLTVSHAAKTRAVADFRLDPTRVHVCPNGVDQGVFHHRPDVARDPNVIVTAASADVPLKGLAVLMRAMARLRDSHPGARLTVIGRLRDGPARDALEASGLGDRVTFVSDLTADDIAALYARAAVVASPSLFEGFGLPAAEAMACGAAVVATDGGGLPEVVGDAGVITPAGDDAALAAAIAGLLDSPERRRALGTQAAARARAVFSWRVHAEAAVALHRAVIAKRIADRAASPQLDPTRAHHSA